MVRVDWTDHEFSDWFRTHGGANRNYAVVRGHAVEFRDGDGRVLAVIVYDNDACERTIYVSEGLS